MVQELVRLTLAETNASFVKPAPASRFLAKVKTVSDQMATSVTDEEERRAFSLARATDAWQAEFQDAELLQILAAVQSPQQTLDFMKQLSVNSAPPANLTVADTWNLDPPSSFDTSFSRQCYGVARQGLVERGVTELLKDLPSADLIGSLTVREVLEMSPLQAAKVLGGADNLKALQDAFLDQRQQALAAARSLRDGYPGEVVSVLETAAQEGISPGEALIRLKGQVPATLSQAGKAELERQLDNTLTLFQVSGKRLDVLRLRSEG
jgi:hypothetical protein